MVGTKAYFLPAQYCREEEFFCSLPRDSNPAMLSACLHPIFPHDAIAAEPYEPECRRSRIPEVTQLKGSRFWIVTDDDFPPTIACPGSQRIPLSNIHMGADLVL